MVELQQRNTTTGRYGPDTGLDVGGDTTDARSRYKSIEDAEDLDSLDQKGDTGSFRTPNIYLDKYLEAKQKALVLQQQLQDVQIDAAQATMDPIADFEEAIEQSEITVSTASMGKSVWLPEAVLRRMNTNRINKADQEFAKQSTITAVLLTILVTSLFLQEIISLAFYTATLVISIVFTLALARTYLRLRNTSSW